jgi:Domain of unknown function (DUF222)
VHHGLPVTVIVSTTLQERAAGAGQAVTGGGTLLPMRDLIRMASHAYHYLAVFDESFPSIATRTGRIIVWKSGIAMRLTVATGSLPATCRRTSARLSVQATSV